MGLPYPHEGVFAGGRGGGAAGPSHAVGHHCRGQAGESLCHHLEVPSRIAEQCPCWHRPGPLSVSPRVPFVVVPGHPGPSRF